MRLKMNKKSDKERLKAAALRYRRGTDQSPYLAAKGEGKLAERIIAIALEHGVPITEDPDLVTILSKMDPGSEISPELYVIVAELLVFVYRLKQRASEEEEA